jgi:hypothetical protein
MVAGADTLSTQTRASRLVAEALVEGHDPEVFVQRARSMGLSRGLTDVLLAACPCRPTADSPSRPNHVDRVTRATPVGSR